MTSRELILERIRQNKPEQRPLPEQLSSQNKAGSQQELDMQFTKSVKKAGASVSEFTNSEEAAVYIEINFPNAINLLGGMLKEDYDKNVSNDELEKTESVILEAQFGVAENGAVWVDETNFPNRLLPFITRQLVLVLDREKIVENMQEAYQNLDLQKTGFGLFISGPSKTADIEQSLVYGAHGARKVEVLLL